MSGSEVGLVLGLISSMITVIEACKSLYDAAHDAEGLPEEFRKVSENIPLVMGILQTVKRLQEQSDATYQNSTDATEKRHIEDTSKAVVDVMENCKMSVETLEAILKKVLLGERASILERYLSAVRTVKPGRKQKVEDLMKDILTKLQLLSTWEIFKAAISFHEIELAVDDLANVPSSLPDSNSGNTYYNNGPGPAHLQGDIHGGYFSLGENGKMYFVNCEQFLYQGPEQANADGRCLHSLAFPHCKRRGDLSVKAIGTCDWVLEDRQYLQWIDKGGLLWIEGGPGAGKSTIMESIVTARSTTDAIIATFFFHRQGNDLQHSALGFFRSLLHQILLQSSEMLSDFCREMQFDQRYKNEGQPGWGWEWTESDLRDICARYVQRFTSNRSLKLYIDALDEAGEDTAKNLIAYLELLRNTSTARLDICISCRPWPPVISKCDYVVTVEDGNAEDIKTFIHATLESEMKWNVQADLDELKQNIAEKASGVFQWVILMTKRVISLQHEDKEHILAEICRVPQKLSELYEDMILQLDRNDCELALRILQWITFAIRPLSLAELRFAVIIDPEFPLRPLQECESLRHWCRDDEKMLARVRHVSRGLIKVVDMEDTEVVQFNHESVQDYMSERGISVLRSHNTSTSGENALTGSIAGQSHYNLFLCCIRCLAARRQLSHAQVEVWKRSQTVAFMRYVSMYCMRHARVAEAHKVSQHALMEITEWPSDSIWTDWDQGQHLYFWGLEKWNKSHEVREGQLHRTTLQHIASRHGLYSVLDPLLQRRNKLSRWTRLTDNNTIFAADINGLTPLANAILNGHGKVVKLLIDTGGVDVNYRTNGVTPLFNAVERGNVEVVKVLLGTPGIDVNASCKEYGVRTALQAAAKQGHLEVVQLLLKEGAVVNAPAAKWYGVTALQAAAGWGHLEVVQLLLKEGAVVNAPAVEWYGVTALQAAAGWGHLEVVQLLLKEGAVVNAPAATSHGVTALRAAEKGGHKEVFNLLLNAQKDANAVAIASGSDIEGARPPTAEHNRVGNSGIEGARPLWLGTCTTMR